MVTTLILLALSVIGTANSWFAFATGTLYTESELEQESKSSFERGRVQGRFIGDAAGYDRGYREGERDGLADGQASGYLDGWNDGHRRGCLRIFTLLGTDRVMDFWEWYRGDTFASYYTRSLC